MPRDKKIRTKKADICGRSIRFVLRGGQLYRRGQKGLVAVVPELSDDRFYSLSRTSLKMRSECNESTSWGTILAARHCRRRFKIRKNMRRLSANANKVFTVRRSWSYRRFQTHLISLFNTTNSRKRSLPFLPYVAKNTTASSLLIF